ncbi:MAG: CDGSH iron-sulfur domain-containing protein [Phycisphaerales bacterium]
MPRMVYLSATDPIKIDPKTLDPEKKLAICACGLSKQFPMCDGSHKPCRVNEEPGKVYVYDRTNSQVVEVRDDRRPGEPDARGESLGPT